MVKSKQEHSYKTINHHLYPIFSWMMLFTLGAVILIMSVELNVWKLWPFFTICILISSFFIAKQLKKLKHEYKMNANKYGVKNYATYTRKHIWVLDFYGIIALLFLILLLIVVIIST